MFASSSRLDLGITVGPQKPGNIKTILSSSLPIFIDYRWMDGDLTGSALWRFRAALRHQGRVREISFGVTSANFNTFFEETGCHFPVLESLALYFSFRNESKIPDAFLRGPDLSVLHLRRLKLTNVSLASVSGFLLSATALTDLYLVIDAGKPLLACLQGMPCLRSLALFIAGRPPDSPWQPSTLKDIIPLSQLTSFRYYHGRVDFLEDLVAGLSAPSLQDVEITLLDGPWPPVVHLPRFINEIEGHYHGVHAVLDTICRFSLLHSENISQSEPRFNLNCMWSTPPSETIFGMGGALSTRLTTVEKLSVTFGEMQDNAEFWVDNLPWLRFYQQFPSVKVLQTKCANDDYIARTFLQAHEEGGGDELAFLPALEEIELGEETFEDERESRLAAFQPFVSVRQQAGRPVKVFFSP
jgi:hypothetical protein